MNKDVLVRTEGVYKRFPGVIALNNVSFDVRRGEILSVVGENGAGKSTLMNILSGVYPPSSGSLFFDGKAVHFKDSLDAQRHGVAMIHQELSVAPKLSVMENIYIGRLRTNKLGLVDYKLMYRESEKQLRALGSSVSPDALVSTLSTSERQIVEIAKALSLNAQLLIMDEPTSSLSKAESEKLLETVIGLSKKGVSILFVSHKMDEVFTISDRIAVFRDGEYIKTLNRGEATRDEIISLMVGRTFIYSFQREYHTYDESQQPLLEIKNLNSKKLHNIALKLHRGEVLALTGLIGAGRTELLQSVFGLEKTDTCEVYLEGKLTPIRDALSAKKNGIGLVPEGRKLTGLFMNMSVQENETLCILNKVSKFGVINRQKDTEKASGITAQMAVKTPSLQQKIKFLSGGNQQKCIIGRWLMIAPRVLFLDEPTHGIDVGAKAEIYKIIDDLSKQGVSILLVSSELPEVLALADRILVMHEGHITAEILHHEATQENIMQHAFVQENTCASAAGRM